MNTALPDEPGDPADDAASPADTVAVDAVAAAAMNDQLRGDVTSWRAARSEAVAVASAELAGPAARVPMPKSVARRKHAKPVGAQPATDKKKPFGMSYDGMSQADYISYMISRGAR